MYCYILTTTCFLLVAQATPLIPRYRVVLRDYDDSTSVQTFEQNTPLDSQIIPSTENQLPSLDLPNKNPLLAFTSTTDNEQPHDPSPVLTNSFLSTTQSNVLSPIYGNLLAAAEQAYISKGCNRPDTCQLCESSNHYSCFDAEVSSGSNRKTGTICPLDRSLHASCITYTPYVPTSSCSNTVNHENCLLCDPNNEGKCVSANVRDMFRSSIIVELICPSTSDTNIDCVERSTSRVSDKCDQSDGQGAQWSNCSPRK